MTKTRVATALLLAFALPLFAKGDLGAGIQELEKGEAAFDNSPARILVSVGLLFGK